MLEIILPLVSVVVGYVVDRWGYNRTIAKAAERLVPALPNATARKLAEQAVIAANMREVDRALAKIARARAEHDVRLSAIESGGGQVHVGNLNDRTKGK